jgi:HPt (histidine-containing phosphotransfer) domain-containing protein
LAAVGSDTDAALRHCAGDEDFLAEIISDIIAECPAKIQKMEENAEAGKAEQYAIDAHAVKGIMATIGMEELSRRAAEHEKAGTEGDMDFIRRDYKEFLTAYKNVCESLKTVIQEG